MLERLQKRGLISYSDGVINLPRRKVPGMTEQTVAVPLVGAVACGLPSLAEQDPEALIDVSTRLARPGHTYFLLRAQGTSMNKSGINNGDLVLVRQQPVAQENDRVVALINDEATIKHFHREGGLVILRPNSKDKAHKPIVLTDDLQVHGVVVAAIPRLDRF
jgi:repressor LexA